MSSWSNDSKNRSAAAVASGPLTLQPLPSSNSSSSISLSRKRPVPTRQPQQQPQQRRRRTDHKCSICETAPAAVLVNLSTGGGGMRKTKSPLCWLHYYTSRAVRAQDKDVQIITITGEPHLQQDETTIQKEIMESGVQDLFAEAYLELQQELATESALSFQNKKSDPLAILNNFRGKPKHKPKQIPPPADGTVTTLSSSSSSSRHKKKQYVKHLATEPDAGGFLRSVQLPQRYVASQQALLRDQQQEQLAAVVQQQQQQQQQQKSLAGNPYQKRKPSRASIWKLAMQKPTQQLMTKTGAAAPSAAQQDMSLSSTTTTTTTCTSCGSNNVYSMGNISNRNNDAHKAETWGSKDRSDEIIQRYQCNKCGRTWNEEC